MANTDIIDEIVSSEAFKQAEQFKADMKALEDQFVATAAAADKANASINGAKGIKDLEAATKKYNEKNIQLLALEKEISRVKQERANLDAKLLVQNKQAIADNIKKRTELQKSNAELKAEANLQLASIGSIEKARASIKALSIERDKLNLFTKEGRDRQAELNKQIDAYNAFLTKNVDAQTKQSRNVGNYQGSAKIIVDALERTRLKVVETTKRFGDLSPEAAAARREFEGLQRITDQPQFLNISAKVGDTNAELRFFGKQLNALEDAGLKNTKVYGDVQQRLEQLTDQLGNTRAEIKALASDTRGFDLFAGSVNFAADAFQTYAGAAQLAGASEEDAAQATATLVAVQSVSNGVKGIANELTTKGTAANKLFAFTQKQLNTVMQEGIFTLKGLKAALIATGIGALIVGVGLLVANFGKLKGMFDGVSSKQKDIVESSQKSADAEQKKLEIISDQDNVLKLQGKSEKEILKLKIDQTNQVIAQRTQQLEAAKELLEQQVAGTERNRNLLQSFINFITKPLQFTLSTANKLANLFGRGFGKEQFQGILDDVSKRMAEFVFDPKDTIKDGQEALIEIENQIKTLNNTKAGFILQSRGIDKGVADKEREAVKKQAEEMMRVNKKLAEDEAAAFQQREEQKALMVIENLKRISEDEKLFIADRLLANTAYYAAQEALILRKAKIEQDNLLSSAVKEKEEILQRKLTDQELLEVILQTNSQALLIQDKANADILRLKQEGIDKQQALIDGSTAKEIEKLGKKTEDIVAAIDAEEQARISALETKRKEGSVTQEQYEKERLDIQNEYALKRLKAEIESAEALIAINKAAGIDTADAERKLQAIKLKIAKETTDQLKGENEESLKNEEDIAKRKKELYKELFSEIKSAVFGFIDDGFTRQKNTLEREKVLIDERKSFELSRINALNISEAEKADKIKILDASVQDQKDRIARRQKQLDIQKAKFDKFKAAFDIGINTAVGITKVVPNPVLIALVAAIGAIQLAAVLSKPIPEYWTGTEDSKGGPVWLGERGKELLITPDNKMYETPGTATLASIPEHSKVVSNPEYMKMLKSQNVNSTFSKRPMNDKEFIQWQIKQAEKHTEQVVDAIKNSPKAIFNLSPGGIEAWTKHQQTWYGYIDKKVRFKS